MEELKRIDREFYRKLGQRLHEERVKRGYSLRYLSELTGISRVTLDNYELGYRRIDFDKWKTITKALYIPEKIYVKVDIGYQNNL